VDEDAKRTVRILGYISTLGLAMALCVAIGVFTGYYIDKKFGTAPWFFFIFLGFGIVAAFRTLYIMYKKADKLE